MAVIVRKWFGLGEGLLTYAVRIEASGDSSTAAEYVAVWAVHRRYQGCGHRTASPAGALAFANSGCWEPRRWYPASRPGPSTLGQAAGRCRDRRNLADGLQLDRVADVDPKFSEASAALQGHYR